MEYPAHISVNDCKEKTVQSVGEHCLNTASYALGKAIPGTENIVKLAAILHDMGKYTEQFKDYIEKVAAGINVRRGSVNHTFAGVRFSMDQWHTKERTDENFYENLTAEVIAYAAGSHHGQFDCMGQRGADGYSYRIKKEGIDYPKAKREYLAQCTNEAELNHLFSEAAKEMERIYGSCNELADKENQDELYFYLAFFARYLLSLVIDGDRTDTAIFMHGQTFAPTLPKDMRLLWDRQFERIEQMNLDMSMSKDDTELNRIRKNISDQCCESPQNSGIFRLSVPTGGGKTLTSLRYAIATARKFQKKRIFFVIPLLTVLEQNADVIRESIANPEIVLEHHSNILKEEPSDNADNDSEGKKEAELLMETWDSPIVITTMVQLLNTLFSGKPSCIRRMNALANSVIIIDEVQSLPIKLISIFNLAMDFLSEVCNANIVLCSATQPCLGKASHALRYSESADLVKLTPEMRRVFRRTEIIDLKRTGGYTVEELAELSISCMEKEGNALLICNTKGQANQIYECVKSRHSNKTFHLSTSMCMAHRKQTLEEINACLDNKERFVCVATQLVEAGVDFSFRCVIRVSAGLDNIVQAAGRCNRHKENEEIQPVYIVNVKGEDLKFLKEIKEAQIATESVLLSYESDPDEFQNDLLSEPAISEYYQRLYTDMPPDRMDYCIENPDTTIYSMLSDNQKFAEDDCMYMLRQAFKTAGKEFKVFDQDTYDVLVPYGCEAENIIKDLGESQTRYDFKKRKELLEKAKPYIISLYCYEKENLEKLGGIRSICDDSILVLHEEFYSTEKGVSKEGGNSTAKIV